MKKILYMLVLLVPFFVISCNKEELPEGGGDGDGTEQSGEGNGNGEDPEPDEPEYDPETQVYAAGLIWDKYSAAEYVSFSEAESLAKKQEKRIPTHEEWETLSNLGYKWDGELIGYWYGEDSEKLSESEKSVFLRAAGYYMIEFDQIVGCNETGRFWSCTNNDTGYYIAFVYMGEERENGSLSLGTYKPRNTHISAHFLKNK